MPQITINGAAFEFQNDDGDEVADADVDPGLFVGLEGRLAF